MTYTVTIPNVYTNDNATLTAIAQRLGYTPTSAGTDTGNPATPPGSATNYFPDTPGTAPFPSPEDSTSSWVNGAIQGSPYLRDLNGVIYQIVPAPAGWTPNTPLVNGDPDNGSRLQINGVTVLAANGGYPVTEMIVRQGQVWVQSTAGSWQYWVGSSETLYNGTLPLSGAAGGALPSLPALPVPASPAPGTSGQTVAFGPTRPITTLTAAIAAAKAGDTIVGDPGTYTDTPPSWSIPLHLKLTGCVFNAAGKTASLAKGMGLFVPAADCIIDGVEITGVAMDQTQAELTSAIRPNTGCGYLTLNGVNLHDNQCGLGHGGFTCVITDNASTYSTNGLPPGNAGHGYTHNIYTGEGCYLTLNAAASIQPNGGHAVKHRGPSFTYTGGVCNSWEASPIDLPEGTTTPFLIQNVNIQKKAGAINYNVFAYGEENQNNGLAGGVIVGCLVQVYCDNPFIQTFGGPIVWVGNTVQGGVITVQGGGTVTGI